MDEADQHGEADHGTHEEADGEGTALLDHARDVTSSGTAWQPRAAPHAGWTTEAGPVHLMLHGNVFVGWNAQGTPRGDALLTAPDWVMGMSSLRAGRTETTARVMLSAEPLVLPGDGYPLLLQSGEAWRGEPLVDRQHPHDLFMELAVDERVAVTQGAGVELYAALAGEPALGPPGFPHRPSAAWDPLAPLSHHWQDATHISFGVLTAGVFSKLGKLEVSFFNGREPDEHRLDLDLGRFASWSGRLTATPVEALALQVSYGYLHGPEELHPDEDVLRLTGSAMLQAGETAATLAWGTNLGAGHSVLLEGAHVAGPVVGYGRLELVQKPAEDLGFAGDELFAVPSAALGAELRLPLEGTGSVGLGARGQVARVGAPLDAAYETAWPAGGMVYLHLAPPAPERGGGHH